MNGRDSSWRTVQIIRHCTTALNSSDPTKDRIRGWSDYSLSEVGKQHAKKLATIVSWNPPDILLSSNLIRAVETAVVIADTISVPLEIPRRDFRPWDLGEFVGKPSSETIPIIARLATHMPDMPAPKGESFNSFRARFFAGLLKAFRRHHNRIRIGIVTHNRCERLLRAWAKLDYPLDGSIDETEFQLRGEPTGYCGMMEIPVDRLAMVVESPRFGDGREEQWLDWLNANG